MPQLQAEARVDPKTGLFNARHFAAALTEELGRAQRFERPMSLIMADLDLLRDINNTYGHLAGDAVLKGIAEVFRAELRHYDVPARFGGEEFAILLPETPPEQALEIAERIRRAVAERLFDVETSSEPIRATVSIGVAGYPKDGRTRTSSSTRPTSPSTARSSRAATASSARARSRCSCRPTGAPASSRCPRRATTASRSPRVPEALPEQERRHTAAHASGPRFLQLSTRLGLLVGLVDVLRRRRPACSGALFGTTTDVLGLLAVIALVGVGQALALELDDGSISVSAVGALAGAALFGPRAALRARGRDRASSSGARSAQPLHHVLFNVGALTLSSLAAAAVFMLGLRRRTGASSSRVAAGLARRRRYFAVNTGLLSLALALEGRENAAGASGASASRWLLPHYVVYGFIGGVIAIAYAAAGALRAGRLRRAAPADAQDAGGLPPHTRRSAQKLRQAAETIQTQNVSLEQANRLLKERSTAAMESLSATVDARDAYTAGHSRRVQQLALAIGRELGLSQAELDLLGHAALFHDIGKLAIPDAILLKPASLTDGGVGADAAARRRGRPHHRPPRLPDDAVPAIRHHHERFDGTGYPDRLRRRGDPARRPHHPRRRRARLDADDAHLPRRPAARGGARRSSATPPAPSSARAASRRSSGSSRSSADRRSSAAPELLAV